MRNRKYIYSSAKIFEIYDQLHERGLAMFLGVLRGQPMIWMDGNTPLARAPISIATANVLLSEILRREAEGADEDILIGEVLDSFTARQQRPRRRAVALISAEVL